MSNLAICIKGDNKILYFIKDCVKNDNSFCGSNIKLIGLKTNLFDFYWTEDIVNEIYENNKIIGYEKTSDEFTISDNVNTDKPTQTGYIEALKIRNNISNFDYQQIDQYIDNSISDINSAKEILKMFGKVILSLCRQIDYNI